MGRWIFALNAVFAIAVTALLATLLHEVRRFLGAEE